MAVTSGFFNDQGGDRKYTAEQFTSLFDGIINDGVFPSYHDALHVTAGSGMQVVVGTGRAWFDHTWTENSTALVLEISAASSTQNRIDAVVLRVDKTLSVRANKIYVKTGTAAGSPTAPTMEKTTSVTEYPLALIHVNRGVTNIATANITNKIGTSECPFVSLVNNTFDSNKLIEQWEAIFNQMVEDNNEEWEKLIDSVVTDPDAITSIPNSVIDGMFVIK